MRHTQIGADPGHKTRLVRRLGPQPVIHRHRPHLPTRHWGGAGHQMQHRHGIAAARNGQPHNLWLVESRKRMGGKVPQNPVFACRRGSVRYGHCNPGMALAASVAAAVPAKRLPTSVSVMQASFVCPKAPSASPSFIRASGARGPSGWPENASR